MMNGGGRNRHGQLQARNGWRAIPRVRREIYGLTLGDNMVQ
jgi:hypothetical protein